MYVSQSKFQFIAGNLALDFVNTVGNRTAPIGRRDYWRTERDVAEWAEKAGIHPERSGGRLSLKEAVSLREALYRIFLSKLRPGVSKKADLHLLNRFVRDSRASWKLELEKGSYRWKWNGGGIPYPLAMVVESAASLLTSADLKEVRQCKGEYCGWLFLDRSQAKHRKWCSMEDCGNRAKVRRFLRRRRPRAVS